MRRSVQRCVHLLVLGAAALGGCLTRPTASNAPTTKTNFITNVKQAAVDKIDLLLAIDNSGSMGDKQRFLAEAVPNLVARLVTPNCVDGNGALVKANGAVGVDADPTGLYGCPAGSRPEFSPIVDIHIGVVSSNMGGFGGDQCDGAKDGNFVASDGGRLVQRGKDKAGATVQVAPIEPAGFLGWYPESNRHGKNPPPAAPYASAKALSDSFGNIVRGVGENGCGLEAQLESMYHFLIQPDPYASVAVSDQGVASYAGIDGPLIAQRHDFLRPDSLVAVIMLTDEDDSSVDPLAVGGNGWRYMSSFFSVPGASAEGRTRTTDQGGGTTAPRGTSACTDPAKGPGSPECDSCLFQFVKNCDARCERAKADPACRENNGFHKPEDDILNVRFQHMKERYGVDPQYPIQRYVSGLTKRSVPDRTTEHDPAGAYADASTCTNPLFARTLPRSTREGVDPTTRKNVYYAVGADGRDILDAQGKPATLCTLPRGERDAGQVFFAVVGGVPNDLLHFDPSDPDKSRLGDQDWEKILGRDPSRYDLSGIDPRMVQSTTPRAGRPGTDAPDFAGADPGNASHRDWDTGKADLQYACTFALPPDYQKPKDDQGDCKNASDAPLCDAKRAASGVCGANPSAPGCARKQVRAKAFPTVRELAVVRALGEQGIAASLCPQETANTASPLYGYNPGVKAIVDRLANVISRQCLPRPLHTDEKGQVSCLMLAVLPDAGDTCAAHKGYSDVAGDVLKNFRDTQRSTGHGDQTGLTVCSIEPLVVGKGESCDGTSPERNKGTGWCYVTGGTGRGACPQAIEFSQDSIVPGATVTLQCIDQSGSGAQP